MPHSTCEHFPLTIHPHWRAAAEAKGFGGGASRTAITCSYPATPADGHMPARSLFL